MDAKTQEAWLKEGDGLLQYRVQRCKAAMAAYEQAIQLKPQYAWAYGGRG